MIKFFRIGKITTLHGIKGEVKVFSTTDDIKRFDKLTYIHLSKDPDFNDGTFEYDLEVESVKYVGKTPVLKLKGYENIEDSTKLVGYSIYIDRKDAVPLSANEYYLPDLIGLKCYVGNELVGDVKDAMCTKANGILVIANEKKDILLPFVYDFVEKVDLEKEIINLRTLEGLL